MGARAPGKLGINRARWLQCHICHKNFQNLQGLRAHQICIHKIKPVNRRIQLRKRNTEIKYKRQPMLKIKMPTETTTMSDDGGKKKLKTNVTDIRKTEFGCPKCNKMFPVYFSAYRHIQKYHTVNVKGEKKSSTNQIKPVRYELCAKCNKQIHSAQSHICDSENQDDLGSKTIYICLGCDQQYSSMHLFDLHLSTLHSTCVESLFLPTFNELMNWKRQLELQTSAKYLILGNSNIKQIYRCTYESRDEKTDTVLLCPSSIVIQEFSKGIQVHYYKEHYGHSCNDYKLSDKFKKFSITNLMKNAELYMDITDVKSDEDDLYLQFKKLMSCIIFDAAKINITTLKVLHGKALEMTSILNNYDEDEDLLNSFNSCESRIVLTPKNTPKSTAKISDDQITNELEVTRSSQRIKKRINDTPVFKDVKKIKINEKDPLSNDENYKQNATVDDEIKSETTEDETCEASTLKPETETKNHSTPKVNTKPKQMIQSPSSFNDSYKNFVDTTFKMVSHKTSTPLRRTRNSLNTIKDIRKKVIVKTKMGQFIPGNSPKKAQESNNVKDNTDNEEDSMTDTTAKSNILKTRLTSKSSNILKATPRINKFKPTAAKISQISKVKTLPDIKYEVKEQENDCNILILKI